MRLGSAEALLEEMVSLARAGGALDLRLARLIAWFKRQDLAPLGYSSLPTFCRERVGWGGTWQRQLVRLVESDLKLVKRAVFHGLPMTVAILAPGRVEPNEQATWLMAALRGEVRPPRSKRAAAVPKVVIHGRLARQVHAARDLARLVVGWPLSVRGADAFVLGSWRQQRPGEEILAEARETPAPPDHEPVPAWGGPDPATALVGPWREPVDLEDGLRLLEEVQRARRERKLRLGCLYARVARKGLHQEMGFDTLAEMAREGLGCSVRTLERHRKLAEQLEANPVVGRAVEEGLDLNRAQLVLKTSQPETTADWVEVAQRTGVLELQRATRMAARGLEEEVLATYKWAMAQTTNTVALRAVQEPAPAPAVMAVHPDLPQAAEWFVETVRPEPQKGFGKVKERDRFVCQNPECGRRSLRAHAHHLVFRSEGGSDDETNGVAVCSGCHLRLAHTGLVSVRREGDAVVWTYPGGRSVTVFDVPRRFR
ncbi:MAG: HNH endonuclease [Deltaproteobacteria bacterium]|nr:HNH endonuclease [Deltaproteobacteria bacterium]